MTKAVAAPIHELLDDCIAEYRFFRNSIQDFEQEADLQEDQFDYLDENSNFPHHSIALGYPCIEVCEATHNFPVPDDIIDVIGEDDTAFTIEYVGIPRQRQDGTTGRECLIGGPDGEDEWYIEIYEPGIIRIEMGAGADTSANGEWWFANEILHLLVTRTGDGDATVYSNGAVVNIDASGTAGIPDPSYIFNYNPGVANRPFEGSHFFLRFFDRAIDAYEARSLFGRAQKMFPNLRFPIPVYFVPA